METTDGASSFSAGGTKGKVARRKGGSQRNFGQKTKGKSEVGNETNRQLEKKRRGITHP